MDDRRHSDGVPCSDEGIDAGSPENNGRAASGNDGMKGKRFVRHSGDGSEFSMPEAFACAFCGVGESMSTQRNFKVHIAFAAAAVIAAWALGITPIEWIAVVGCIGAVFALETLNTGIEAVVDLVSPEWNRLAKTAKDCAAGAVLVAALTSVIVGCIVFIPRLALLAGLA